MIKDILLLAVSSKGKNNYCVAGIDLSNNAFIRLVSDDPSIDYAIKKETFNYIQSFYHPKKLHIIRVDVDGKLPPDGAQTENWLTHINNDVIYISKYTSFPTNIIPFTKTAPYGDSGSSISEINYALLSHSIEVVEAYGIFFTEVENQNGERRIRINFSMSGAIGTIDCRDFRLTDPEFMYDEDIIEKTFEKAFLVITIGPNDNKGFVNRYKFVSGIHLID